MRHGKGENRFSRRNGQWKKSQYRLRLKDSIGMQQKCWKAKKWQKKPPIAVSQPTERRGFLEPFDPVPLSNEFV